MPTDPPRIEEDQVRERVRQLWAATETLASTEAGDLPQAHALLHLEALRAAAGEGASPVPPGLGPDQDAKARHALAQPSHLSEFDRDTVEALRSAHRLALERLDGQRLAARARLERRVALGLALVLAASIGVVLAVQAVTWLTAPTDLAKGKPWKTSSTWRQCHPDENECAGEHTRIFFITNEEQRPWYQVDLGEPREFSRLTIVNRSDIALERAVPLVVEVSDDGQTFKTVARQEKVFATWQPDLGPQRARYLRLTVDRFSALHLEAVRVHR